MPKFWILFSLSVHPLLWGVGLAATVQAQELVPAQSTSTACEDGEERLAPSPHDQHLRAFRVSKSPFDFQRLVEATQTEFRIYLESHIGQAHAADIQQKFWLQIFRKIDAYDPSKPARPWLYSVLSNQSIDHLRAASRRPTLSLDASAKSDSDESMAIGSSLEAKTENPFTSLAEKENAEEVRAALGKLTENQRKILLLHFYEGLNYNEMADRLNIPLGTVKSRLKYAKEMLKRRLAKFIKAKAD